LGGGSSRHAAKSIGQALARRRRACLDVVGSSQLCGAARTAAADSGSDPASARSTGPALFAGGEYVSQLWLFWIAPIVGAAIAGFVTRWLHEAADTM
jgi:Major intrinsic protein